MTSDIATLIEDVRRIPSCDVLPPIGAPSVPAPYELPPDVLELYNICGGLHLFTDAEYPLSIVAPNALEKSNPAIIGSDFPDDITDSWFLITRDGATISIDCHPERIGRCYDSFWDVHGVAGSCPVIALSFTELLQRLIETRGGYWYWLRDDFAGYGDAYAT